MTDNIHDSTGSHRCIVVSDRKGILAFLLLAFGTTFVYEGCLVASGNEYEFRIVCPGAMRPAYTPILIGLAMWIPAISTAIVVKFITNEGFGVTNFRLGALKPYVVSQPSSPLSFHAARMRGLSSIAT